MIRQARGGCKAPWLGPGAGWAEGLSGLRAWVGGVWPLDLGAELGNEAVEAALVDHLPQVRLVGEEAEGILAGVLACDGDVHGRKVGIEDEEGDLPDDGLQAPEASLFLDQVGVLWGRHGGGGSELDDLAVLGDGPGELVLARQDIRPAVG